MLLRKGVYTYEYMDSWKRFNETSLPDKKTFCSEFYSKDITNRDYTHAQKVFEVFNLKNLGDYHDLYVQSDTLLLADVFENFRRKCIEIYWTWPCSFFVSSKISMASLLKKDMSKIRVINRSWYVINGLRRS